MGCFMLDRAFAGTVALLVLAVLAAPAFAISTPSVTFIPDKISTNGAFLAIADPHAEPSDSVIVTWGTDVASQSEINSKGSFPKSGGKYVCYFSNTDNESTCGPAPFKSTGGRHMLVQAVNQDNTTGIVDANLSVGDIQMSPTVFTPDGRNISIRWPTSYNSNLLYKVYYAANYSEAGFAGAAPYIIDGYYIDIPTGTGDYFISLKIDYQDRFGGTLLRYEIPEEGVYAGGGFVNLAIDTASFDVLLNKGQNYQRTGFSMTNLGSNEIENLSVAIPSDYISFLSVTLSNSSIAPNGTIFYTLVIGSAQHTMEINTKANLTSGNVTVGYIPIKINVSIVNECEGVEPSECPAGSGISLNPTTWTGSYLAGTPAELNFTVSNLGNTTLSNLSYTSSFGSSLTVSLPSTLLPNGYAPASAALSSSYGGVKSGTITITSAQGSAKIAVLASFYEDTSSALSDMKTRYTEFQINLTAAQRNALADAFSDIDSDISSAESAQENGDYQSANDYYNKAAAKLSVLESAFEAGSPVTQQPQAMNIDFTAVLIVVVIVVVALVAFIFIRRRRRGGGEDELEEELSEEFGPLPGEK